MERRGFLQLLCVGMGMVLATKPTKAITLVAPPLTQTHFRFRSNAGNKRRQVGKTWTLRKSRRPIMVIGVALIGVIGVAG